MHEHLSLCFLPGLAKGPETSCWDRKLIPPTESAFSAPALSCFAQGVSEFTLGLSILSMELLSSQGREHGCICKMDGPTGNSE